MIASENFADIVLSIPTRAMRIIDFPADDQDAVDQVASLLVAAFREDWPNAWPTPESARAEVLESLTPERISRIAVAEDGQIIGWIGAISEYDGNAWELHPLVVSPDRQGKGIGRALVSDLEEQVRSRGGMTIYLGTDDENEMTSLANADLYRDLWQQIATIRNLKRHPFEFYQKLGFVIVGVIPDANGRGKPDILMAKRIADGSSPGSYV